MNPDVFVQKMKQCGWWDELPATQRDETVQNVLQKREANYYDLADFVFDTEFDGIGPYEGDPSDAFMPDSYYQIVQLYARSSRGLFNPTNIQEEYNDEKEELTLSFDFEGDRFQVTVPRHDDWFREEVHDLINKALEKKGIQERFQWLPIWDQMVYGVFVKPHTYERAVAIGLIPTEAEPIEYEMPEDEDEDF